MTNPHEAGGFHRDSAEKEQEAKKAAKSLYRELALKIHPDHFNHGSHSDELKK